MNTGRYTLKSFLTDHNLDQILVPELQRDYVWQPGNVLRLLKSISEDAEKEKVNDQKSQTDEVRNLSSHLREILERELEKNKTFSNIGFIYAYYDIEFAGRYMLIDGQQRMTTIFLLLLSLHIKEGKEEVFRRNYFKKGVTKFDYKVRDNAHNFLTYFIEYILGGGDLQNLRDQYWYHKNYENDVTIKSIYNNYEVIKEFLNKNELTVEYIEDNIEFYYFDTNKSEQGEELYIYMNSRGESITNNENIKANLLDGLSELEKNEWGTKWESWQSIFWGKRGENKNADKGFDEFLKWIKIIEEFGINDKSSPTKQAAQLRLLKESKKFDIVGIAPEIIESYVAGLTKILKMDLGIYYSIEWLNKDVSALDYIKLLPILMYAEKYPECTKIEIKGFARFFYNIARFETISRNPYNNIILAVQLTSQFLKNGFIDAADLSQFKDEESYNNILTGEESWKLFLFKKTTDQKLRSELEIAFWEAEDFKYLYGRIQLIWTCMDFRPDYGNYNSFDFALFKNYSNYIQTLFKEPSDLLRRAILSKGDFAIHDGDTSTLGGKRFSFIAENNRWKDAFNREDSSKCFIALLQDFHSKQIQCPSLSQQSILEKIISTYSVADPYKNWRYLFIHFPTILDYCSQKFVCFVDEEIDNIYLLRDRNAVQYNFKRLSEFFN